MTTDKIQEFADLKFQDDTTTSSVMKEIWKDGFRSGQNYTNADKLQELANIKFIANNAITFAPKEIWKDGFTTALKYIKQ